MDSVDIVVGSRIYTIPVERINCYSDSYFATALKPHWNQHHEVNGTKHRLHLERCNMDIFEHIIDFLRFGSIPRRKNGDCLIDRKNLPALREEADFFCLHEMVEEIDELISNGAMYYVFQDKLNSRKFGEYLGDDVFARNTDDVYTRNTVDEEGRECNLISSVMADARQPPPFVMSGQVKWYDSQIREKGGYYSYDHVKRIKRERKEGDLSLADIMEYDTLPTFEVKAHWMLMNPIELLVRRNLKFSFTRLENDPRDPDELHLVFKEVIVNAPGKDYQSQWEDYQDQWDCGKGHGYVFIVAPTFHVGGNVIVTSNEGESREVTTDKLMRSADSPNDQCTFIGAHRSEIDIQPVTEGIQVIFVFDIVNQYYRFSDHHLHHGDDEESRSEAVNRVHNFQCIKNEPKREFYEGQLLLLIREYIFNYGSVGIVLEKTYVTEGLNADSLQGLDAILYKSLSQSGYFISLVYAVREIITTDGGRYYHPTTSSSTIRLLDDSLDTRLKCHKDVGALSFVNIANIERGPAMVTKSHGDKFNTTTTTDIIATMIVGGHINDDCYYCSDDNDDNDDNDNDNDNENGDNIENNNNTVDELM